MATIRLCVEIRYFMHNRIVVASQKKGLSGRSASEIYNIATDYRENHIRPGLIFLKKKHLYSLVIQVHNIINELYNNVHTNVTLFFTFYINSKLSYIMTWIIKLYSCQHSCFFSFF